MKAINIKQSEIKKFPICKLKDIFKLVNIIDNVGERPTYPRRAKCQLSKN